MQDILIQRHSSREVVQVFDELVNTYTEVYSVPPYKGDPFFSTETYATRLRGALSMEGFETVTAKIGSDLVGYVHGVTLSPEQAWWVSLGNARSLQAQEAASAQSIFWLRELMVRPSFSNRGIGRHLHDMMISGRGEPWTTLTCIIDNEPAHGAYLRWGYQTIGRIKHAPESPLYDAMLLLPP